MCTEKQLLLRPEDITENIVIIKINQLYRTDMTDLELYETTRGIWRRRIESVQDAEYALAVLKGKVIEVYSINGWYPAGTFPMETRKLDPERCKNRIEFTGKLAPEGIRRKYIGKSVAGLFKFGEANPVKFFPGMEMRDLRGVSKTTSDPEDILKKELGCGLISSA